MTDIRDLFQPIEQISVLTNERISTEPLPSVRSEESNLKFSQEIMEITDQNCVNFEDNSAEINVRSKSYLFRIYLGYIS